MGTIMKIVLNYECPTTHTKSTEYPCKKRIHATGKIGLLGECQFCKTKKAKEIHEEIVVGDNDIRSRLFSERERIGKGRDLPIVPFGTIFLGDLGKALEANKICRSCKKHLPLASFHKDRTRKDGLKSWCKECSNVRKR